VSVAPVPDLLARLRTGDQSALNDLLPALYDQLHRIASRHLLAERRDHTLQPTALVHEAYLKLFSGRSQSFTDEVHFLAVASRVMRQVLVDYARGRSTQKRSAGDRAPVSITSLEVESEVGVELLELIQLDGAIQALGGMTAEETAEVLAISVHTVRHDLRFAQAWLRRRLAP
jgi:RNA polymerase sigma-70 factor (ECF subfamily)